MKNYPACKELRTKCDRESLRCVYTISNKISLFQEDSSLECAKFTRHCRAKNIYLDFRGAGMAQSRERYDWSLKQFLPLVKTVNPYKPSVLWDIGKQCKTRSDTAKRGV